MGFIKFIPIGNKKTKDLFITNAPERQLWQQIVMIRHLNKPIGINDKSEIVPWVDQAKTYFLDAHKSDWRSAGLLYYYSFLNLAKAYIVAKKGETAKKLMTSNIYHGLSANPQTPKQITDFEIKIHPPVSSGIRNVFASYYEKLIGEFWPHSKIITITVADILPYCHDIADEVSNLYNINSDIIYAQSLIREENNSFWLEVKVPNKKVATIQNYVNNISFTSHPQKKMSDEDFLVWYYSHKIPAWLFKDYTLLKSQPVSFKNQNRQKTLKQFCENTDNAFANYILMLPVAGDGVRNDYWQFIPPITLDNVRMNWHPFFSDYLIAFVLSTILRYHPHLLSQENQDSFLAEEWCAQSATTALRYFLMSLTTPPLRFN